MFLVNVRSCHLANLLSEPLKIGYLPNHFVDMYPNLSHTSSRALAYFTRASFLQLRFDKLVPLSNTD